MSQSHPSSSSTAIWEAKVIFLSGVFMTSVGIAFLTLFDGRINHFMGAMMIFTGSLLALPPLVAAHVRLDRTTSRQ